MRRCARCGRGVYGDDSGVLMMGYRVPRLWTADAEDDAPIRRAAPWPGLPQVNPPHHRPPGTRHDDDAAMFLLLVQVRAAGIGDVLADPAGAARMGAAARRTVEERYTMARVAEMWMAAYNEVLGRRP